MRPNINVRAVAMALFALYAVQPTWAQTPVPSGAVVTIAGNGAFGFSGDGGPATSAELSDPYGLAIGRDGALYFSDIFNARIRRVDPLSGVIGTIAGIGSPPGGVVVDGPNGDGGPATSAQFGLVFSVAIDRERNTLYIADNFLSRVRQVNLDTGIIENFAGKGQFDDDPSPLDGDGGPASVAYVPLPLALDVGANHDVFFGDDYRLRRVDQASGTISRVAGIEDVDGVTPFFGFAGDGGPASAAGFNFPRNLKIDRAGNMFIADLGGDGQTGFEPVRVRRIDHATGIIETVAGGGPTMPGSGPATEMNLATAFDLAVDDFGKLFVSLDNRIVVVDLATGLLSPYAGVGTTGFSGDGGPALDAEFNAIGALATVPGGGLLVSDTSNRRVRYIAPAAIDLSSDAAQTEFHLPWVSALAGGFTIRDNLNLSSIDALHLTSVAGSVQITGNASASSVDLNKLESVGGSLDVTSNGPVTGVDLTSLSSVGNHLTIDTAGSGTFDIDGVVVGGNAHFTTRGFTEVIAATALGQTTFAMHNRAATMDLAVDHEAFATDDPVPFSVAELHADPVPSWGSNALTTLAAYRFDFAIDTLDQAATLNFQIDIAALDEPARLALLELLQLDATFTLAVQGDEPGATPQPFDVCAIGTGPVLDTCVRALLLDAAGMVLDPDSGIDPATLRFEALVGHFSTYSIVATTTSTIAGDIDRDGDVDRADAALFSTYFGKETESVWTTGDFNADGATTIADQALLQANLDPNAPSPAFSQAAVPEPTTSTLAAIAIGIALLFAPRRRK